MVVRSLYRSVLFFFFFFFQAEDGIRDLTVTGVQTCALPISQDDISHAERERQAAQKQKQATLTDVLEKAGDAYRKHLKNGRATGRERVEISVVAVSLKTNRLHAGGRSIAIRRLLARQ